MIMGFFFPHCFWKEHKLHVWIQWYNIYSKNSQENFPQLLVTVSHFLYTWKKKIIHICNHREWLIFLNKYENFVISMKLCFEIL